MQTERTVGYDPECRGRLWPAQFSVPPSLFPEQFKGKSSGQVRFEHVPGVKRSKTAPQCRSSQSTGGPQRVQVWAQAPAEA